MNLEGRTTRLRALEPGDIDLMYAWENDTAVWSVSGTLAPFSRHTLERFIQEQQFDIFQTRQQRLVIETLGGIPVGALDFFELDPINRRAGIGILIHDDALRGKGYASDAVETACRYAPRGAEPAPALVQRRFRQRPQPETLRQSGIRRSRRQTRLAMAAGRLRR